METELLSLHYFHYAIQLVLTIRKRKIQSKSKNMPTLHNTLFRCISTQVFKRVPLETLRRVG